jgi:hypothetical protein
MKDITKERKANGIREEGENRVVRKNCTGRIVAYVEVKLYDIVTCDRLCGLMVRVPAYRSRGPGFDSRRYQIFREAVSLERGPLNLVRITEEPHERTVAAPV